MSVAWAVAVDDYSLIILGASKVLAKASSEVAVYAVHWQKIVDRNSHCVGYEALARLVGVSGAGVEKAIGEMSLAQLRKVTSEVLSLVRAGCATSSNCFEGTPLKIFINVEKESLVDRQLVSEIIDCFESLKARNYQLALELTERPISKGRVIHYVNALYRLKRAGVTLVLDDYDINDSVHLELGLSLCDLVKIDINSLNKFSQVDSMETSADGSIDVKEFFRRFGVPLLAEKVENNVQMYALSTMPFEYFQGYLIGRPSPSLREV